jgi:Sulfate permease family
LDGLPLPLSGISAGADCFDFGKNVGGVFIGPIGGRRPGIEAKTVNAPSAPAVAELAKKLLPGSQTQIHVPTLVFGLGILLLLRLPRWWSPRSPGPLVAVIIGTLLCFLFNLESLGISLVDKISAVLPTLALHMTKGI